MAAEQPLFNVRITSEFYPARGPKWIPEPVRIFFGNIAGPEEITHGWDGLTLETARERGAQAKKETGTKEVLIFLAE